MKNYPRLCLLAASYLLAYALYHAGAFDWIAHLHGYGYASVLIAGLMFSFGFTTPFAIAIFIEIAPAVNPFLAAPLAAVGALVSDICIFDLVRMPAFEREFVRLQSTYALRKLRAALNHERVPHAVRHWILLTIAGVIIASPLPDEIGVSLLGGLSALRPRAFATLSLGLNFVGVFIILVASRLA